MRQAAIRRIRLACIVLSHIPLAAILTLVISDGTEGDWPIILTSFGATLLTAIALFFYLGQCLGPQSRTEDGTETRAAR
ncbi:hypothetical protein [Palleronia sp. LCG004]|uniref:hypothetical protein n=1 Tax=Palleronia sp. LCG004 TaxID=3079304 RepID=UPI002941D878|nr:hypothetical protein [Palleronia sp. LCG004]WOI55229.1 hypothetical protein RVY76_09190 [Palleronia sp. LCG004]